MPGSEPLAAADEPVAGMRHDARVPRRPSYDLSLREARRLALAAQGFAQGRPAAARDRRHLRRVLRHTGVLQIDSVNVLLRAHYLPAWSRIGGYPRALLDRMAYRDRELFEYWGHEASLLPVELHPLLRWRMRRARDSYETWGRMARLAQQRPGYVAQVLREVERVGPVTAGELAAVERRAKDGWGWNWTDEKTALEYLFWTGDVTTADRRGFERVYDLTERVLPRHVLERPTPSEAEAQAGLLLRAAAAYGVATVGELADYFRIKPPTARPLIEQLVAAGELDQVRVEGWRHPGYVLPGVVVPRRVSARALLVPFDPVVWERARTLRLWGFDYRIEIYVPPARRRDGYYVLPFLLGDSLVARVDLKADRQDGVLRVRGAWAEPGAPAQTPAELAAELAALIPWLGLDGVDVEPRGDLSASLAAALR